MAMAMPFRMYCGKQHDTRDNSSMFSSAETLNTRASLSFLRKCFSSPAPRRQIRGFGEQLSGVVRIDEKPHRLDAETLNDANGISDISFLRRYFLVRRLAEGTPPLGSDSYPCRHRTSSSHPPHLKFNSQSSADQLMILVPRLSSEPRRAA